MGNSRSQNNFHKTQRNFLPSASKNLRTNNHEYDFISQPKTIYNNIDHFLDKVGTSYRIEWKDDIKIGSQNSTNNNLFNPARRNQFGRKGLELRKEFCPNVATKLVTLNYNRPQVSLKNFVKSLSVILLIKEVLTRKNIANA